MNYAIWPIHTQIHCKKIAPNLSTIFLWITRGRSSDLHYKQRKRKIHEEPTSKLSRRCPSGSLYFPNTASESSKLKNDNFYSWLSRFILITLSDIDCDVYWFTYPCHLKCIDYHSFMTVQMWLPCSERWWCRVSRISMVSIVTGRLHYRLRKNPCTRTVVTCHVQLWEVLHWIACVNS